MSQLNGDWIIKAPADIAKREIILENESIICVITYTDNTIIRSEIYNNGSVKININKDYIINNDGTIEIKK